MFLMCLLFVLNENLLLDTFIIHSALFSDNNFGLKNCIKVINRSQLKYTDKDGIHKLVKFRHFQLNRKAIKQVQ